MAEWLKAADCKSALIEYVGSNPTLPTILISGFDIYFSIHVYKYRYERLLNIKSYYAGGKKYTRI